MPRAEATKHKLSKQAMELKADSTRIAQIVIKALGGSSIDDCIKEAIVLSAMQRADVVLVHNEKEYIINYAKINNAIDYPG